MLKTLARSITPTFIWRFLSQGKAAILNWRPSFQWLLPLGSERFERTLIRLLEKRMQWRIAKDWEAVNGPHFSYNNYAGFRHALLDETVGPYPFYRGFFSSEVVREGDKVLDIGCGDGFFSTRFLATKASCVDAIDVETDAIEFAQRYNRANNVRFFVRNAITDNFPDTAYDVIVWDGAIGHFSTGDTAALFAKIRANLKPGGIFCGSEILGTEGESDHFQHWATLGEAAEMFSAFKHRQLRECEFFRNLEGTARRREFYWRCSDSGERVESLAWRAL